MINLLNRRFRTLALIVLVLVLASATYGFAAANSVPNGKAGEGSGVISGYTVSSVVYTLDSSDPTAFASVAFSLDAAASDVYAGIGDGTSIYWTSCGGGPLNFTCNLSGSTISVLDATQLHVSSVE